VREAVNNWRAYRAFKRLQPEWRRIVIYSESGQDWHHFASIVKRLADSGERVCYLTSDPQDAGLDLEHECFRAFCIGSGTFRTLCFQFLDAGVMVMTMVDFNNLQLRRSINPVRYAFMFHSLISVHMADHADSYDHYDAVLCAGPHQMRELRKREAMLEQPAKQLFEHGYERLETLMQQRRDPPPWQSDADVHVLLAPSWGDETILNVCGEELTDVLIEAGFRVTLRPHYQTRWLTPELIDRIAEKYADHAQFRLMEQMGESDSLLESHVMITDWSGAGMDYGMGLEKPVLYFDVPPKSRNDSWQSLEIEPFEMQVRAKLGRLLPADAIAEAPAAIRELVAEPDAFRREVEALRNASVYNLGSSAAAGADSVKAIADRITSGRGSQE